MTALVAEMQKAKARLDFDPVACVHEVADKLPREIAPPAARRQRLEFLQQSLGTDLGGIKVFERVLLGNEIQPASYLARGAIALQSIARIDVRTASGATTMWGTGFLIAPNVLITNNHVLASANIAKLSQAQFGYEIDLADAPLDPVSFTLDPDRLFLTDPKLDFTVVAVNDVSTSGQNRLRTYGYLPLLDVPGKVLEGEWLTIAQHPRGERKQLCVRENKLIKRADDVLWYSTDTLPGSSGAPVFNNDWFVVALHHSGVAEEKDGKMQTIDGRDYDPDTMDERYVKWIANEGIRASRIAQTLKQKFPGHPLLQGMFEATPASARIRAPIALKETAPMSSSRVINVPFNVAFEMRADGSLVPSGVGATAVGTVQLLGEAAKKKKPPAFDVDFDDDYSKRQGFQDNFLGNGAARVHLPQMSQPLKALATKVVKPTAANDCVLHYHNFSNVMHVKRRFAIYSAANVSFAQRYDMSRPADVWRRDPRIPIEAQIENWYYASNNFDRGHLTRREDLEFGATPQDALASAADTCHWSNCTPQHSQFNQNKEIWQGIERHLLENAIVKGHFNAQVFTGPVFDEGDPEYRDIQYPQQYWKVVAALDTNGKLFATAYVLSQVDVIDQFGIEAEKVPFSPYKTYQVKIREVERLTDLTFHSGTDNNKVSLRDADPLDRAPSPGTRRRVRRTESMVVGAASGYVEIADLDDIQV